MITDKKIGVLMGGMSAEREVSIKSGTAILNTLKKHGYNAVEVMVGQDVGEAISREKIELAFLALHGGSGEDGSIQGLLEVTGIPYTGSGVLASALAMDKEASKKIFLYHDIPVPPFKVISRKSSVDSRNSKTEDYGLSTIDFDMPWVIKPATEGSSIGISIIKERTELAAAFERAFEFGERVIVEKYVKGREIQVGILNDKVLGSVEVRPKAGFYSYEAKYKSGMTDYILPPDMRREALVGGEKAALSAHMALGCRGATRVDLIACGEGDWYVLEVNTIPGMTETSLLPKIAGLSGLDFHGLVEEILGEAIRRGDR